MGRVPGRERCQQKRRVGLPRAREYGAAGDEQIRRTVDPAIAVDDPVLWPIRHTRGADLVIAVGRLIQDAGEAVGVGYGVLEPAEPAPPQAAIDDRVAGDDRARIDLAIAQVDPQSP